MKETVIFILLLCSLTTFGRMPSNPYFPCIPDFENLLGFTKSELQIIKEKGIKNIEVVSIDTKEIYYFDKLGQLTAEEIISTNKKKHVLKRTIYKYNDTGLLILKHIISQNFMEYYDSLAYDKNGKISYYYSYNKNLYGKKKFQIKDVVFDLHVVSSTPDFNILADNSDSNSISTFILNNTNQVIRGTTPYQIDSVSFEFISNKEYYKKIWFKGPLDTNFKVGQEKYFKNNLIQIETLYQKGFKMAVYKMFFIYDQNNHLIKTEYDNKYREKSFYTYNDFGLVMERIDLETVMDKNEIFKKEATVSNYSYQFR